MTPEDDVNKDTDQESIDETKPDLVENAKKVQEPSDDVAAESENVAVDFSDKAAEGLRDLNSSTDEVDQSRNAQSQDQLPESEDESTDQASATDEDPLGFLDKNADGSVDNPDDDLQAQLEDANAQIIVQKEQMLRIQAEMENQRKRAQNDVTKAHKFALEKIALDLLPVKDSLEMGLAAATAEDAEPTKIIEGSELTLKMLAQALEKYNIVEINPLDEKFDPEFHQAMTMQPVEGKEPNTVASVMQKGYTLNERLIRPALVMVAK